MQRLPPQELYCSNCDVSVHHQYVLHNRESFVGGFYKAMSPKCIVPKDSTGEHVVSEQDCLLLIALPNKICCCGAEDVSVNAGRAIIFINIKGRYDLSLPLVTCKSCLKSWTPEVKDLILNGYWPGTSEFQTVYTVDLFSTFEDFKVTAPGLSRQAFVRMLQSRSNALWQSWYNISGLFSAVFWNGRTVHMRWKHFLEMTISPVQLAVRIWWQCLLMGTGTCTGLIATDYRCTMEKFVFAYPLYLQKELGKTKD
ncbi:uncharacterized protein [Misgurnus anguillicaudatus]|uniref:uncharacterized protein n=1 Tax=Misgurnus anguillicaudatus TaxID=75329 RepID=UPI003CCF34BF